MSLNTVDLMYLASVIGLGYIGTILLWLFIGPKVAQKALFRGLDDAMSGKNKQAQKALNKLEGYFTTRAIKKIESHLEKALKDPNSREFKLMYNMTGRAFEVLDAMLTQILQEGIEVTDDQGNVHKVKQVPESFKELFKLIRINMMQSFSQSLKKGISNIGVDTGTSTNQPAWDGQPGQGVDIMGMLQNPVVQQLLGKFLGPKK